MTGWSVLASQSASVEHSGASQIPLLEHICMPLHSSGILKGLEKNSTKWNSGLKTNSITYLQLPPADPARGGGLGGVYVTSENNALGLYQGSGLNYLAEVKV